MAIQGSYYDIISAKAPKVWFKFDETSGTPINIGPLTCTITALTHKYSAGGPVATTPPLLNENTDVDGRSVSFNGDQGYYLSNFPAFSLFDDRSFSIELWFKVSAITDGAEDYFVEISGDTGSGTGSTNVRIQQNTNGTIKYIFPGYTLGINSTISYADNKWHHLVATYNTSTQNLYIDGGLVATRTGSVPTTLRLDNISTDSSLAPSKKIGARILRSTGGTYYSSVSQNLKGGLDELAFYDYELTASQVNENYVAGSAVYWNDTAQTVSSLMVMPTWVTDGIHNAAPMTASATGEGHAASTVTFPTMLETYMSGLTLETWYKFDTSQQLTNYAGTTKVSIFETDASTEAGTGIQGSGRLLTTGGSNGGVTNLSDNVGPLIADKDFSFGFWTKKATNEVAGIVSFYDTTGSDILKVNWTANGYIEVDGYFNNNSHAITSSTDVADGNWHYVAVRQSNNTLELFVDGTSIGTTTITHAYSDLDTFQFGNDAGTTTSEKLSISQFYVATAANITSTEIGNIYTAGTSGEVQASARMPEAKIRFNSAFNDYIVSKNPLIDLRMDEGTGAPLDYGSSSTIMVSQQSPQGYTQNETSLNTRAFKFTDRLQAIRGNYSLATGTVSSADECTIGILFKNANATNQQGLVGFGGRGGTQGTGFSLQQLASSGYLRIIAGNSNGTTNTFTGTTNVADNKWHLAIIVKEASTIKLYIDGKQDISSSSSNTLTDSGEFSIAAISGIDATTASRDTLIDEIFVTAGVFSAQEAFEAWQALRLEMDTTATATFPMVTNIVGTGTTQSVYEATASSEFVMPEIGVGKTLSSYSLDASSEFLMPNFGTTQFIDSNYGHTAAIADAEFHDPQLQIGDIHSAASMDGSAQFVMPVSISTGTVFASTGVGSAEFVMPGIVTIKGARVFAEPARANAILPLPPLYITLGDDQWYKKLLEGHADKTIESIQQTLTNLPNQATTDVVSGGFLSFFEDVSLDITPDTTIKTISSEIPAYYFDKPGQYSYNQDGTLVAPNTSKAVARATASRGSTITTPRLGVGYFDPYERKAVRVENIEFPLPGTSPLFSQRPYNLEFSIKTTKQDQVLAYGYKTSTYSYGRNVGAIGLSDGKIYLTEDSNVEFTITGGLSRGTVFPLSAPHPKKFTNRAQYLLSKTSIADGNWHHVIIQYGFDGRTQIWIDGKLDRQIGTTSADGAFNSSIPGLDGTNTIRPYILGFNSNDSLLYSDFEISAWNFYPGRFLNAQNVGLNHQAYLKSEPIKVSPMLGTVAIGQNNDGRGNKNRMLLLYWWQNPVGYNQNVVTTRNPLTTGYVGNNSPFDPASLIDDPKKKPEDYFGWDIFPVSVTGRGQTQSDIVNATFQGNTGGYLDIENGRLRYLDLQNDLNLDQFDMIMFANYPTTSAQLDEFIREEDVDSYFGVKEKDIYQDFLKSLRKAVDSGMNLLVQFDQLARDLKVYNRVETIPVFSESDRTVFDGSDPRAIATTAEQWNLTTNSPVIESRYELDISRGAYWQDRSNNMRHRIVNTLELLTDDASYIWTDTAFYQHSDELDFGAPDRRFDRYEYRMNGLQPGDEFIFGNPSRTTETGNGRARQTNFLAIPFENVLAGKIITAQPEKYYKAGNLVDNPYKNYAHSIAISPGDILDGTPVGGKIFVNIAETYWDYTQQDRFVDLYTDYWIDLIYELGIWGLKQSEGGDGTAEEIRNKYKTSPYYVSTTGMTAERAAHFTYWSRNDQFVRMQFLGQDGLAEQLGLFFGIGDDDNVDTVPQSRKLLLGTTRNRDKLGRFASGVGGNAGGGLFFQISTGRVTDTANVYVPNLFTRGMLWLSDRIRYTGKVIYTEAMKAEARFQPTVSVVDKDTNVNANAMISNALLGSNISGTVTKELISVIIPTLPLTATATMVTLGNNYFADEATATAILPEPGVFAYSIEEVILKLESYEPVLYIRGDKIR